MKLMANKIIFYYLPLLIWSMLIFLLSSMPGSGEQYYDFWFFWKGKAHI